MSLWEKLINGKYQKWIYVCSLVHFIFEIKEDTLDIIVSYRYDWDKHLKLSYKMEIKK